MDLLLISLKDIICYMVIIMCLLTIAFILLKFWSMRKEEKEEIVVHKIQDNKPKNESISQSKLESEPEEEISSELEAVLKQMQESLDQEKDVTQMFEEEQEEKAIISYQELVRANLKQEIKEEPRKEEFDIPKIEEDIPILDTKEEKKFKQTDFISPIYGTMDVRSVPRKTKIEEAKDFDIEEALNLNGISEEKKKNAEFLKSLKEFRSNL